MSVLFETHLGFASHASRGLEVAKELRKKGHEIVFAGQGNYQRMVENEGFPVFSLDSIDPEAALKVSIAGRGDWYDYPTLKAHVDAERDLLKDLKPELVVSDFRMSTGISCEAENVPLAVILNGSWTNFYAVKWRAPEHFPITRALGKVRGKYVLGPPVSALSQIIKGAILKQSNSPFNKLRRELGLPLRGNLLDSWTGNINLIADSKEYAPTKNLPDNFHYIGPIIWEPKIDTPAWLREIAQTKPVLYITNGSTGNKRLFFEAMKAFEGRKYQCIMTTAGLVDVKDYPANFFVTDFAPGSEIMKIADAVVCQGGNGTIYQALRAGVPIVGVPNMHDQEFNMQRVVDLGAGIQLSGLHFSESDLESAVERVLSEKKYKDAALDHMSILSTLNGPEKGAEVIDRFLSGNLNHSPSSLNVN